MTSDALIFATTSRSETDPNRDLLVTGDRGTGAGGPRPVGIDTVRLRGPLLRPPDWTGFEQYTSRRPSGEEAHRETRATQVLDCGISLKVEGFRARPEGVFELSVPNFVAGTNIVSASVEEARSAVAAVYRDASDWVEWAVSRDDLRLMRLDTDRDFEGAFATDELFDALVRLRVRYGAPRRAHGDDVVGTTSIARGRSGRWMAKLYVKSEERRSLAYKTTDAVARTRLLREAEELRGLVRFELVLRRPVLRERSIETMSDLTDENIASLNRAYFERVGFGQSVGGPDPIKVAAVLASPEEYRMLHKVYGQLLMDAHGLPAGASRNTVRELRRLAKRLGLTTSDLLSGGARSVRLDYDTGRVVAGPDA